MEPEPSKTAASRFTRKWPGVLFAATLLVTAIWLVVAGGDSTPMPVYQGRTARQWFGDLHTGKLSDYNAAGQAFRAMGSNAIPFLIHELERTNSAWANFYARNWPRLPNFIQKHLSPGMDDYMRYYRAGTTLENLQLKAATPELARLLSEGNPDREFPILMALMDVVGPEDTNCIAPLEKCFQSKEEWVRLNAVGELNKITRDERVIPVLTNLLGSTNWALCDQALEYLREVDPKLAGTYELSVQIKKPAARHSHKESRGK